jgi:hypothetical protein
VGVGCLADLRTRNPEDLVAEVGVGSIARLGPLACRTALAVVVVGRTVVVSEAFAAAVVVRIPAAFGASAAGQRTAVGSGWEFADRTIAHGPGRLENTWRRAEASTGQEYASVPENLPVEKVRSVAVEDAAVLASDAAAVGTVAAAAIELAGRR